MRMEYAEAKLQKAASELVRVLLPDGMLLIFAGGDGERTKAAGYVRGTPDGIVVQAGRRTGFLEFKSPHGRVTPEQAAMHDFLRKLGFPILVCRSLKELELWLEQNFETRAPASSNGRTTGLGPVNGSSTPSAGTKPRVRITADDYRADMIRQGVGV